MAQFQGVFPALITPFTSTDELDERALRKLVRHHLDAGVDGFFVCGSSSEMLLLSMQERMRALEVVLGEVSGACPLIAHIGCVSTAHTLTLGLHAKKAGVQAVCAIPPIYYRFTMDEIHAYFCDIADGVGLPTYLYNFPNFTGTTFDMSNLGRFFSDERFCGMKHTCDNLGTVERVKQLYPRVTVFMGYDGVFLPGLVAGADGGIGSLYNFMSEKFVAIYRMFKSGDLSGAQAEQHRVCAIAQAVGEVGTFPGIKALLELQGLPVGNCRKPFGQLTTEQKQYIRGVYEQNA